MEEDEEEDPPGVWRIPCPCCGYSEYYSWDHQDDFYICPECHHFLDLTHIWLDRNYGIAYGLKLVRSPLDRNEEKT
jgi:hypothetical protein